MNQIKIGCIGTGYWGKNLVRNFAALEALAWVCDAEPAALAPLAAQYPQAQFTGEPDRVLADPAVAAVAIATPAVTHGALVRQALLAGKDVFVEKPLCLCPEQGEELVALAAARKRILMVGHLLWYHPAVLKLQELVQAGALGRIQYIYSHRLNLGKIRREENILWSFAPHDVSVILGLVGEMPDQVAGQGGNYLHNRIADVTVSVLGFPSGIKAHIFVSWLHPYKEQKLVVVGDRKMAVFNDTAETDKLVLYPHSIDWKNQVPVAQKAAAEPVGLAAVEPLRAECGHFLECVAGRRVPRTDGREGVRVLRVLRRCQEALEPPAPGPVATVPAPVTGPYFVHPSATIDEEVSIGEGTAIWHVAHVLPQSRLGRNCRIGQNVVIGPRVRIGDGVKIQNNVSVYEGVTLEDHVFCGPSMVFTNVINPRSEIARMRELRPTLVRRGATLGANCTIVCGVSIGAYAFVGAGAVVVKDVPAYGLVVGNPARLIGWVCVCGHRLAFVGQNGPGNCPECQRTYTKSGEEVTLNESSPIVGSASPVRAVA